MALHEAAKVLKCSSGLIREVEVALGLPLYDSVELGESLMFSKNVDPIVEFFKSSVTFSEAASSLGCYDKSLAGLIERNLIRVLLKRSPGAGDLLHLGDIRRIVDIIDQQPSKPRAVEAALLPPRKAFVGLEFNESDIIAGLAAGKLHADARAPDLPGLKGLLFDRDRVIRSVGEITGRLPYGYIRHQIGWADSTLKQLRKLGHLSGRLSEQVDLLELGRFRSEHVTTSEMLMWDGAPRSRDALQKLLRASGVQPTIELGPKYTRFWPRKLAKKALSFS